MKRFFALALAILTLLSLPAMAENYYVDAENGSDSNSGTAPETAWKTLKNVKLQNFQTFCSLSTLTSNFTCSTLCVRAQLPLTLCCPMGCSSPGSSARGIFQARNTGVGFHLLL